MVVGFVRSVDHVLRRYLRRRHNFFVYGAAVVFASTLMILSSRVLVPQSHLQERLAIWWGAPQLIVTEPEVDVSSLSSMSTHPAPPTRDPLKELRVANTLKRDIFSEESYQMRLRTGRWKNASSRVNARPSTTKRPEVAGTEPYHDLALTLEERVDDLVSRMTLEEVVSQMTVTQRRPTPGVKRLGVRPFVWTASCSQGQGQRPLGTAFPHNLALAASFSPDLVRNVSNAIAIEMRAFWSRKRRSRGPLQGLSCLGPTVNLMRHPLWAQSEETFGEDPFLTSQMATSYIVGLQGKHPRYIRVAAACKYFVAHNGSDTSAGSIDMKIPDRDFEMSYLPPFKACAQAGAQGLLCTANTINGQSPCSNGYLLNDLLREQYGFTGFIAHQTPAERAPGPASSSPAAAAAAAVRAGCNMDMNWGTGLFSHLTKVIGKVNLTEQDVRDAVKPILRVRMRLGEFDPPTMTPYSDLNMSPIQNKKHQEQAVIAAMMTFVLLKNRNRFLPLSAAHKHEKVAIVGPFAEKALQGINLPAARGQHPTPSSEGLRKLGKTAHAAGCTDERCEDYDSKVVERAVTGSDLVVVCLGVAQTAERKDLSLPANQLRLLQDASKLKKKAPLLFLLFAGGPVDIAWAKTSDAVNAIVFCFLPAQGAGDAIWRILTRSGRKSSPVARLPFTWPASLPQVASGQDYSMKGRTYRFFSGEPLFPFGYGLSYSTFNYTSFSVEPREIVWGEDITLRIGLRNEGPFGAEEIVQVYMHWGAVAALAPRLQLVGYRRMYLSRGPDYNIKLVIQAEQMAIWVDRGVGNTVLPGEMTLYVGGQQPFQNTQAHSNILKQTFTIKR